MEHLDLYVSGKTRVYFNAMHFEGKPLLLILIAFCFFWRSQLLFFRNTTDSHKTNLFDSNLLISFHYWCFPGFRWTAQSPRKHSQPETEKCSRLVAALLNTCPFHSPGTACSHNTSATAQKPDLKRGQKPEAAFHCPSEGALLSICWGRWSAARLGRLGKGPASL